MDKRDELVRFDWAIKRILRDKANFGVLEGLLSVVLKDDVKIIKILESEGNKQTADDTSTPGLQEAREKLKVISMSKAEQNEYEKFLHDQASFLMTQKIEKEYAHRQGKEEGLKQGIEEGLKQGIAEGAAKEKLAIAANMKKLGLPVDVIIETTGLDTATISEI